MYYPNACSLRSQTLLALGNKLMYGSCTIKWDFLKTCLTIRLKIVFTMIGSVKILELSTIYSYLKMLRKLWISFCSKNSWNFFLVRLADHGGECKILSPLYSLRLSDLKCWKKAVFETIERTFNLFITTYAWRMGRITLERRRRR